MLITLEAIPLTKDAIRQKILFMGTMVLINRQIMSTMVYINVY